MNFIIFVFYIASQLQCMSMLLYCLLTSPCVRYVGNIWVSFFMFYRIDLHSKTHAAWLNRWWNIRKNRIEYRTSPDLVMVIGSACLLISKLGTKVLPNEFTFWVSSSYRHLKTWSDLFQTCVRMMMFDPHRTTYESNLGVWFKKNEPLETHLYVS